MLIQLIGQDENSENESYVHLIYRNSTIAFSKGGKNSWVTKSQTLCIPFHSITPCFRVSLGEEIGICCPFGQSQFLYAQAINFICAQNNKQHAVPTCSRNWLLDFLRDPMSVSNMTPSQGTMRVLNFQRYSISPYSWTSETDPVLDAMLLYTKMSHLPKFLSKNRLI